MFGKKELKKLDEIVEKLNNELRGYTYQSWEACGLKNERHPGLLQRVELLETKNSKLEAIVAELVDHVYGDKK